MKDRLIIGSRGSKLALWQAEWVRERLGQTHPHTQVAIEIIKTSGDVMKEAPLAQIGGQGVFTKELESALLSKRIDLAVHSLKDLPTIVPNGLTIAAITAREDARDALVLQSGRDLERPSIRNLPEGSVVGTSSPRRLAQLKHLRPDLSVKELRGNVDTRLRKLDAGEYDAVILASAGLLRLGLGKRISAPVEIEEMLPAVGQGALAIETRKDEMELINLLAALEDKETRAACTAERALLRSLGGGCQLPIAAHALFKESGLQLHGMVAAVNGETIIRESLEDATGDAEQLGSRLGLHLLERGAQSLIDGFTQ